MRTRLKKDNSVDLLSAAQFAPLFCNRASEFSSRPLSKSGRHIYFCVIQKNVLDGFLKVEESELYNDLYLGYLEIANECRGQGISRGLLSAIFEYANKKQKPIILSPYTPAGIERLHPQVLRLMNRYPDVVVAYEHHC